MSGIVGKINIARTVVVTRDKIIDGRNTPHDASVRRVEGVASKSSRIGEIGPQARLGVDYIAMAWNIAVPIVQPRVPGGWPV